MLVQQILKSKAGDGAEGAVVTVAPDASVAEAAALLTRHRIGAVVVSPGEGRVAGILSERDIVRELARRGGGCLNDRVEALMTRDITTCTRDEDADAVLTKMTVGRFRHLPVIDGGRMVGLISIGDVVKARLSELSMEKAALEGMIMGY
ncbi:MAG: CBS domain-containing protein [Rhodobacteraceae bacterium]|jgi:CBS domain-containing protein|nr:CBS domain-containing protein [Paracoccaceae bacterium]